MSQPSPPCSRASTSASSSPELPATPRSRRRYRSRVPGQRGGDSEQAQPQPVGVPTGGPTNVPSTSITSGFFAVTAWLGPCSPLGPTTVSLTRVVTDIPTSCRIGPRESRQRLSMSRVAAPARWVSCGDEVSFGHQPESDSESRVAVDVSVALPGGGVAAAQRPVTTWVESVCHHSVHSKTAQACPSHSWCGALCPGEVEGPGTGDGCLLWTAGAQECSVGRWALAGWSGRDVDRGGFGGSSPSSAWFPLRCWSLGVSRSGRRR